MLPLVPSLHDQSADTGRPGLARCVGSSKPSCGYGSKWIASTFLPSNVLAPLRAAWGNKRSSDSERTTFHEWPPGPSAFVKSVTVGLWFPLVSHFVLPRNKTSRSRGQLTCFPLFRDLECDPVLLFKAVPVELGVDINEPQEEPHRCEHALSNVISFQFQKLVLPGLGFESTY